MRLIGQSAWKAIVAAIAGLACCGETRAAEALWPQGAFSAVAQGSLPSESQYRYLAAAPSSSEASPSTGETPAERPSDSPAGEARTDLNGGTTDREAKSAESEEEKPPEKEESAEEEEEEEQAEKKWFDKYSIRGYAQLRYNRFLETNEDLRHPQDRSVGDNKGIYLRRARMVFSGDVTEQLSVYIQPDFAADAADDRQHFLQMRDWYADIFFDAEKEWRLRAGQSKVPYGFENLQSSQNRIPLDRADSVNTGAPNERDLGLFLYWAPASVRECYKELVASGLKGSGDYGVLGFGVYNGQSANRPELNENRHIVGRISYPFVFANGQVFETGVSAYRGTFVVSNSPGIRGGDFEDRRIAWSFTYYPQPIGLQGEYTVGVGPELNTAMTAVERGYLDGGYLMLFYRYQSASLGNFFPFVRGQYYRGGNKLLANAPRQDIEELEIGVEWQPMPALELTTEYMLTDRTSTVFPYRNEEGGLLRMQLQWNY